MPEINEDQPATVPAQREAVGPVKKSTPIVIALIAIVALIGIANISSLVNGKKKAAPVSTLPMRPTTANAQQVSSFETQQKMQARKDADDLQRQQELAAEMQQLQQQQAVPGPEADGTLRMTAAHGKPSTETALTHRSKSRMFPKPRRKLNRKCWSARNSTRLL